MSLLRILGRAQAAAALHHMARRERKETLSVLPADLEDEVMKHKSDDADWDESLASSRHASLSVSRATSFKHQIDPAQLQLNLSRLMQVSVNLASALDTSQGVLKLGYRSHIVHFWKDLVRIFLSSTRLTLSSCSYT